MKKIKKLFFNKFFYITLILASILIFSIPLIMNFSFFPKEINIIAGSTHKLNFNIPAVATIVPKDKSVLNVNNVPIENEIDVSLNNPIYIKSNKEGSYDMTLSVMGIPIKDVKLSVIPYTEVIPVGATVGVRINTDGVMVLGIGSFKGKDGKEHEPAKNILKAGDMILKVNDTEIDSKETLMQTIETGESLNMEIKRRESPMTINIQPVKSENGKNQIGVWVRDSTQGVGTLTYINKDTHIFGALGHGIVDVDTKEIMKVKDGKILKSNILGIKKGEKGTPGELLGSIDNKNPIGNIIKNTNLGIYGKITDENMINKEKALPIGLRDEVKIDKATILCSIDKNIIKEYEIEIESINKYNIDDSKSMIIRITDEELLKNTNGIIQGMSGSPIIQNGKVIGAVTHVFVNDPTKGYGIFIENMISNEKDIIK